MNTQDVIFYDLLSRARKSGKGQLQGFITDQVMQKYNELDIPGFAFADEMQLDFTYEQVQGELGLNIMASYVDLDSPAIPEATKGATLSTGRIPRMKKVEYFNEDKVRKMLILEERFGTGSDRVFTAALTKLFKTADALIGGHINSLSYQRHQIISTGKFKVTAENNPNGVKGLTFAAHVPTANYTTLSGTKRWWTNAEKTTEGSTANPINDLVEMVEAARTQGVKGHFEVNAAYLTKVLNHSKVVAQVGINALPAATAEAQTAFAGTLSRAKKKAALEELVGATIVERDHQATVQKIVKGEVENVILDSFAQDVFVFVPDGSLGEIVVVEPIAIAGGNYASFLDGRGLMTVEADYTKKCQSFSTELTALCVPSLPQYFRYLYPNA
jgi:hypothetical protein